MHKKKESHLKVFLAAMVLVFFALIAYNLQGGLLQGIIRLNTDFNVINQSRPVFKPHLLLKSAFLKNDQRVWGIMDNGQSIDLNQLEDIVQVVGGKQRVDPESLAFKIYRAIDMAGYANRPFVTETYPGQKDQAKGAGPGAHPGHE